MKTSEFIRNAVDSGLEPEPDFGSGRYLCLTFRNYVVRREDCLQQYRKACRIVDECLNDMGTKDTSLIGGLMAMCPTESSYLGKEAQNIRFMASEFLALYLEDEGD